MLSRYFIPFFIFLLALSGCAGKGAQTDLNDADAARRALIFDAPTGAQWSHEMAMGFQTRGFEVHRQSAPLPWLQNGRARYVVVAHAYDPPKNCLQNCDPGRFEVDIYDSKTGKIVQSFHRSMATDSINLLVLEISNVLISLPE